MHAYAAPSFLCPTGWIPVVGAACNAVNGGVGAAVSGAAGSFVGAGVGAAFDAAGQWVASGAAWLLGEVGHVMSSTTTVGLGTHWFGARESVMAALAAAVVLPMALLGAIQAIYRQDAAVLTRAFLVHLPLALLLTGVAIELVRLALAITDTLSQKVLDAGGVDTHHLLTAVVDFLGPGNPATAGVPEFVAFVFALVVAVSALTLWLELIVRAAAVSAAALFMPLALAALVWPAISHWYRRLAETLAALILSKFVIAAVLSLGVGAIAGGLGSDGPDGGGFGAVLTGIALLLIAAVSPFTLLKLVPIVEAGAVSHLESVRHRLGAAARAPLRAKSFAMDVIDDASRHGSTNETASAVTGEAGTVTDSGLTESGIATAGPSPGASTLQDGMGLPPDLGGAFRRAGEPADRPSGHTPEAEGRTGTVGAGGPLSRGGGIDGH